MDCAGENNLQRLFSLLSFNTKMKKRARCSSRRSQICERSPRVSSQSGSLGGADPLVIFNIMRSDLFCAAIDLGRELTGMLFIQTFLLQRQEGSLNKVFHVIKIEMDGVDRGDVILYS